MTMLADRTLRAEGAGALTKLGRSCAKEPCVCPGSIIAPRQYQRGYEATRGEGSSLPVTWV
eukprot:396826-Rhodomonas_salina.1